MNPASKKDFLTLGDMDPKTIVHLLQLTQSLMKKKSQTLLGKTVALIFDRPSTRTRVSFEVGIYQLGGYSIPLQQKELQLGRGERIEDTAKVLSRYVDAIVIRTVQHQRVAELATHASIPVINGLTDFAHPCQALSDLFTLQQVKGDITQVKLAYIGDGNNVLHSLIEGAAAVGMNLSISTPKGYEPSPGVWERSTQFAETTGATLSFHERPEEAVVGSDAIYTDVWISMGQEEDKNRKQKDFHGFTVTQELMSLAKSDAIFMHCLPAYRGYEVMEEVIDGPQSVVFQQAENRLHVQKAVLTYLLSP